MTDHVLERLISSGQLEELHTLIATDAGAAAYEAGEGVKAALAAALAEKTGRQVLAVSASQGGTSSELWRDVLVQDAAGRLKAALEYCRKQMIPVEHVWILWCQGETDGDHAVSAEEYKKNFQMIWSEMKSAGAETCFLFQIGHFNYVKHPEGLYGLSGQELDAQYQVIRTAQEQICRDCKDVVWAASFEQYLHGMKDHFHYRQQVYHEVGESAAEVVSKAVEN